MKVFVDQPLWVDVGGRAKLGLTGALERHLKMLPKLEHHIAKDRVWAMLGHAIDDWPAFFGRQGQHVVARQIDRVVGRQQLARRHR